MPRAVGASASQLSGQRCLWGSSTGTDHGCEPHNCCFPGLGGSPRLLVGFRHVASRCIQCPHMLSDASSSLTRLIQTSKIHVHSSICGARGSLNMRRPLGTSSARDSAVRITFAIKAASRDCRTSWFCAADCRGSSVTSLTVVYPVVPPPLAQMVVAAPQSVR